MAPTHSQNTRTARLSSVLGPERLVFLELAGTEAVNSLFDLRLRGLAEGEPIAEDDVLVTTMTIEAAMSGGGERAFDGVVTSVRYLSAHEHGHVYEFDLKPWLWLLGKSQNSRIFHQKTAPEIVEAVFADWTSYPFAKYELRLQASYPLLEYTVQYRESDLDFVRRLLEENGINFHFEMKPQAHLLVLSDNADAFALVEGGTRPFRAQGGAMVGTDEHFSEFLAQRAMTTGKVTLHAYDFKRPTTDIEAEFEDPRAHNQHGVVDYIGRYVDQAVGKAMARRRAEGLRVNDALVQAGGDVMSLAAGQKVGLTGHPLPALNADYVCMSASHRIVSQSYRSGGGAASPYQGAYVLAKADVPIAPPRVTAQAQVRGPQTGVVVGEGEIDCDEYGRILVCFHWDRDKAHSMRCRVQQSWASAQWGTVFIPRIGMEVVVEFLEGDPDRPLVTGCVYNARNMPPEALPANKTLSGIWTSSVGGDGFNSLTFEDKSGSEMITLHGQQDMQAKIERDEAREVVNNRKTDIGVNDTLDVGDKLKITAGTSIELIVGGSSITIMDGSIVMKSREIEVKGMTSVTVESSAALTTKGLTAEHTATAAMTVKGAIVKIN